MIKEYTYRQLAVLPDDDICGEAYAGGKMTGSAELFAEQTEKLPTPLQNKKFPRAHVGI